MVGKVESSSTVPTITTVSQTDHSIICKPGFNVLLTSSVCFVVCLFYEKFHIFLKLILRFTSLNIGTLSECGSSGFRFLSLIEMNIERQRSSDAGWNYSTCAPNFTALSIHLKEGDKTSTGLLRTSCTCNGIGVARTPAVITVETIERVVFGLTLTSVTSRPLVLFCFRFQ